MFHQGLIPAVQETRCQPSYQIQPLIALAQPKAPLSDLIVPPSKRATISRLPGPSNPKLDWLHSVMVMAVLFWR
jgi:hypothetical protein